MTEAQKRAQATFRAKRVSRGFKQRALWFSAAEDAKLVEDAKKHKLSVNEYVRVRLCHVSA